MNDKWVRLLSAIMFTFIINVDPFVNFIPVLLYATFESLFGISLSVYTHINRHVDYLETNATYFVAVTGVLVFLTIVFGTNFINTFEIKDFEITE